MYCLRAVIAHLRQSREITKPLKKAVDQNRLFYQFQSRKFSSQIQLDDTGRFFT